MRISRLLLALVTTITAASGCVITPLDDATIDPTEPVTFSGYAGYGSDTLTLKMFDHGDWIEVATTTSSRRLVNPGDVQNLYFYRFPAIEIPEEAWTPSCGEDWVEFRVEERGSALGTFTDAGMECLSDELSAVGAFTAGSNCYTGRTIMLTRPGAPC